MGGIEGGGEGREGGKEGKGACDGMGWDGMGFVFMEEGWVRR